MRSTQALARHASVATTERYCDLHLFDLRGAVRNLPLPGVSCVHDPNAAAVRSA
jgi:hypothetical protein